MKHPRMPIQLPLKFQNVSTSLAACRWSTQSILISLWTVQAISILAIFDAAEPPLIPRMLGDCNGDFLATEKGGMANFQLIRIMLTQAVIPLTCPRKSLPV